MHRVNKVYNQLLQPLQRAESFLRALMVFFAFYSTRSFIVLFINSDTDLERVT